MNECKSSNKQSWLIKLGRMFCYFGRMLFYSNEASLYGQITVTVGVSMGKQFQEEYPFHYGSHDECLSTVDIRL